MGCCTQYGGRGGRTKRVRRALIEEIVIVVGVVRALDGGYGDGGLARRRCVRHGPVHQQVHRTLSQDGIERGPQDAAMTGDKEQGEPRPNGPGVRVRRAANDVSAHAVSTAYCFCPP